MRLKIRRKSGSNSLLNSPEKILLPFLMPESVVLNIPQLQIWLRFNYPMNSHRSRAVAPQQIIPIGGDARTRLRGARSWVFSSSAQASAPFLLTNAVSRW
jgi:hypothetical protein